MKKNLLCKNYSPCKHEFKGIKIKRQVIDLYLRCLRTITSQYGMFTNKNLRQGQNNCTPSHKVQTDDIETNCCIGFRNIFRKIQHQNHNFNK